jgi:hypothetical protein
MAALKEVVAGYQKLNGEWKKRDLKACKATLTSLKVALTQVAFLPTEEMECNKQVSEVDPKLIGFARPDCSLRLPKLPF